MFVGGLFKNNRHIGSLSELFAELAVLDEWNFGPSEDVTYLSQGIRQLVILCFLDRFVERGGWYTARYYKDNFGIPPGRLRQSVKRRKLASRKVGRATEYPFEGVRHLWRHDVTFVPENHSPSLER
jgi:hypothetical protein